MIEISSTIVKVILQNEEFKQAIYEALTLEYEKKTENLETSINSLRSENLILRKQIDEQQQYTGRNCLILHEIKKTAKGAEDDTDKEAITFIQDHLKINIQETDIDRSHRLGEQGVKFSSYVAIM